MEILIWSVIVFSFITGIIGVFVPMLPDIISLWVGILLARFLLAVELPVVFWWALMVITIFTIGSDLLLNSYYINKFGGSKWTILASILGLFAGVSMMGPPGIILGPIIGVFLMGLIEGKNYKDALKNTWGVVIGLFSSAVIKIILQIVIIIWFFVVI